jgi:hypothetical protein
MASPDDRLVVIGRDNGAARVGCGRFGLGRLPDLRNPKVGAESKMAGGGSIESAIRSQSLSKTPPENSTGYAAVNRQGQNGSGVS